MSGMSSLGIAISGLNAAQMGLNVTGHNLANQNTVGYVRQQTIQQDFLYRSIGNTGMRIGLGTDVAMIRQIRDKFLDISYREEVSKANFYDEKLSAGLEVLNMVGELEGEYKLQSVITDLWESLTELAKDPKAVETRGEFISASKIFIDKANDMFKNLSSYQSNLNEKIKQKVMRVNQLINSIDEYNGLISLNEASGDNANDFRDKRNNDLDELSTILNIQYKERPNGRVEIMCEGNELLVNGVKNQLGLRYTAAKCDFVEPVFTTSTEILDYDPTGENARPLLKYTSISAERGNDKGSLKGLIIARGIMPANYSSFAIANTLTQLPPKALTYPTPNDPIYNHSWATALGPTYITAYQQFLSDMNTYETELQNFIKEPWNYTVSPKAPEMPDPTDPLYGAVIGAIDPAFLTAYANYSSKYTQYDTDVLNYNTSLNTILKENKRMEYNINECFIPKVQMQLDTMVHDIVSLINNTFAPALNGEKDPNAPFGMNGERTYAEIFVRDNFTYADRFDSTGKLVGEDYNEYYSLYTIGNIKVNPLLMNASGYDLIATSRSGDESDAEVVWELINKWKSGFISVGGVGEKLSVDNYYKKIITEIGVTTNEAQGYVDKQADLVQQVDFKRQSISAVSMDEELKNMMTYQHAYNAAARIVNVIDSMIDKVVNGTGRVGL